MAVTLTSRNKKSVTWALKNLYSGSNFLADWKKELSMMALTSTYRNLQLQSAYRLHERTMAYMDQFHFTQLRFYLFLYDVVVQNGGFKSSHWSSYETYLRKNPSATEDQKALKLLEIRLTSVRSQYKSDVSARKLTLLRGQGTVHGQRRNLPVEYCYQP